MNIEFEWAGKSRKIKFDGQSYIPQKHATGINRKTGEQADSYRDDGYYRTLGAAVKRIIDSEFGETENTQSLLGYVLRYELAVKEIRGLLPEEVEL